MKYTLIYIIIIVFLTSNCSKKISIPTVYVSQNIINMIPYSLGQQIQFIGSSGDTLNLNVSVESKFTEEPDCLTCSETGPINAQSIFFTLTHLQDTVIELYSQARFGNYLNFNVGYPRYSNGKWNIMSPSIYVPNNSTELECISSANRNCLDTITIGSIKNINVIKFINSNIFTNNPVINFLYSKENGVLQFEYLNGNKYSLIK